MSGLPLSSKLVQGGRLHLLVGVHRFSGAIFILFLAPHSTLPVAYHLYIR